MIHLPVLASGTGHNDLRRLFKCYIPSNKYAITKPVVISLWSKISD